MWSVFNLQWLRLKREPVLVISFLALTLIFVMFMGGSQGNQPITVSTFSDQLSEAEMDEWIGRLNETETFQFVVEDRETIEEKIQMNQISAALELDQDNYQYLVGQESPVLVTVDQHVEKVYRTHLRMNEVTQQFPDQTVELQNYLELDSRSLAGVTSSSSEGGIQVASGMTLYFAMYTILFGMMNIAVEKRTGTWDRLISSPLKKSEIYLGQLLHHFLLGVMQIGVCFVIFSQVFNYNFGNQYLAILIAIMAFVFASVALGMLIIALVNSPQQLQAVIPIVATGFAMLGGAFWPIELITNNVMLTLAKITPIYHGLTAMKEAILLNAEVADILQPISILVLMGVLFMGIGLNLMERTK